MSLKVSPSVFQEFFQDVFRPIHSTKKARVTPREKKPPKLQRRNLRPHTILFSEEPLSISFQNCSTSSPSLSKLQKKTSSSYFIEKFEDIEKIGEGSFGEVFRARCRETGSLYAVKKSKEPFRGESDRRKKLEEVRKHELIPKHKNCVEFVRAWEEEDYLYIQLELCKMSLEEYTQSNHHITNRMLWEILLDLLAAIKHLHDHDLIHLDIKLENILIDENNHYKLGDFGLVVDLSKDLKDAEEGDPKYLAPELMRGNYTKAADVFSIGITMLELAADLELPSLGPLWHELRHGIFPEDLTKNICSELLVLIKWMMTPDYVERPTVDQLLNHPCLVQALAEYHSTTYTNFMYQQILSVCHFGLSAFRMFLRKCFRRNRRENNDVSGDGMKRILVERNLNVNLAIKRETRQRKQISWSLNNNSAFLNDSSENEARPMDWESSSEAGESPTKSFGSKICSSGSSSTLCSDLSPISRDRSIFSNKSRRRIFITNSTPNSGHCTPRKRRSSYLDESVLPDSREKKRVCIPDRSNLLEDDELNRRQSYSPRNLLPVFYGCVE